MKQLLAADLFCGAGGSSTGLTLACQELGIDLKLLAVNHWDVAIQTHTKNHPKAQHLCESLDNVDPKKLVPGGRLNLLIASPPCQHHSRARGGKPVNDQMRSSAWRILDWATDLYIDNILMENVREWAEWGPLGVDGLPLKSKKGQTFQAFLAGLRGLGYKVEYRILNAADYGDPTTRERLFVMCRRGNKSITWPQATHSKGGANQSELFTERKQWTPARDIIDWSLEGKSIFDRKKPLAPATLERIAAGLRKFGGNNAEPFLVVLRNHMDAKSLDEPMPTVTAGGQNYGLCQPGAFVLGQQSGSVARSVDDPVMTVAGGGAIALVEPFVVELRNRKTANSIEDPLSTVTTKGAHHGLVEPFLVTANHGIDKKASDGKGHDRRSKSLDDPLSTVTACNSYALVEPFIITAGGPEGQGRNARSVNGPLGTILTDPHQALIEPFILSQFSESSPRSVDDPLSTITTTSRGIALVEPFVIPMNRDDNPRSVDDPLRTVTATSSDMGLVEPVESFVIPVNHGIKDRRSHDLDDPMPTVTSVDAWGLIDTTVEPFLMSYYGHGDTVPVSQPVPTVTTKDRFALVQPDGRKIDIRFRMLQPRELASAQGFPIDYEFAGNREAIVKQIGNAVPCGMARALCMELIRPTAIRTPADSSFDLETDITPTIAMVVPEVQPYQTANELNLASTAGEE